jgi:hypothetical protein
MPAGVVVGAGVEAAVVGDAVVVDTPAEAQPLVVASLHDHLLEERRVESPLLKNNLLARNRQGSKRVIGVRKSVGIRLKSVRKNAGIQSARNTWIDRVKIVRNIWIDRVRIVRILSKTNGMTITIIVVGQHLWLAQR